MATDVKQIWFAAGASCLSSLFGFLSDQFFVATAFLCIGCSLILTGLGAEATKRSAKYWLSLLLGIAGLVLSLVGLVSYLSRR